MLIELIALFCLTIINSIYCQQFVSPCPNLFTYDPAGVQGDQWSGTIHIPLDTDLSGLWIRVIFDRPVENVTTDFGKSDRRDTNDFLISRRVAVKTGDVVTVPFSVKFNPGQGVAKFIGFRLNGRVVCPENGEIEATTPVSIDAFTSPCPNLFTYEPLEPNANVWHGNMHVMSEAALSGIWMRIIFDKTPTKVETEFGVVEQKEPANEYLIKNPSHKLEVGNTLNVRISVHFNAGETPPKLKEFRLNARTVCEDTNTVETTTALVSLKDLLVSPCANVFMYEVNEAEKDKWYGVLTLRSDVELNGVWIRVVLDKPVQEFWSEFGEAVMRDNGYLIKNPQQKVLVGDDLSFRISAKFNPGEAPPKLAEIRLNARTVCPDAIPLEAEVTTQKPKKEELISPCPNIFTYEPTNERNKWYGTIYVKSDTDLFGLLIRIVLDKPSEQLGNWFSPVQTNDNVEYFLNNRNSRLRAGQIHPMKFYIKYNPSQPLPKLKEIFINNSPVCSTSPPPVQTEENIDWIVLPPRDPNYPKPNYGPDFKPDSRPSILIPQGPSAADQCGVVATQPVALIHHGVTTEEGAWPWHVALYSAGGPYVEYRCGASLISLNHVLSVAHCVAERTFSRPAQPVSTDDIQIVLGKYRLSKFTRGVQYRQADRIIIHPEYEATNYGNDIAVIKLSSPAEYTNWVRPICLWSENTDINTIEGRLGTVVGWGYDNTGRVSDRLLKASLPVVSHKRCVWSNKEYYSKTVNNRNFCAGYRNGTSVCTGDSGGGLVFPRQSSDARNPVWHIRGLVSISVALQDSSICDTSHYVVFTDVAKFLDWIRQAVVS